METEFVILRFRPIAFAQAGVTTIHHQEFKIAGSVCCWLRGTNTRLTIRDGEVGTPGPSLRRFSTHDFVVHRIKITRLDRLVGDAGCVILNGSKTRTEAERPQG
jgi:hypothetical protein